MSAKKKNSKVLFISFYALFFIKKTTYILFWSSENMHLHNQSKEKIKTVYLDGDRPEDHVTWNTDLERYVCRGGSEWEWELQGRNLTEMDFDSQIQKRWEVKHTDS